MRRLLAATLLVVSGALLAPPPIQATTILKADEAYPVPDFTLTERSGRLISKSDLHGKVWVACFFFTSCNTICPQVTATMARLQERLRDKGLDYVILVSISVDPETDTPAVLQSYAAGHGADADRWLFLTGKSDAEVFPVSKGFLLPAQRNEGEERGNAVTHSPRLVLVDREGRIRGYFDGRQVDEEGRPVDELPELEREIVRLRGGFDFPSLNAVLNGACAVLLLLGYAAIRGGRITLHKTCMLTALVVSAAFLTSYLYYHIVVRGGEPTRFSGPSEVQAVYLGILLSHTVLAVLVAPLALITASLGLAGRLEGHKRIARWTLPIWLYVSITGVVVYWMLYHLYPAA